MMLRSSSTPVLGSLLSTISSENHQHQHDITFPTRNSPSPTTHHHHQKLSFHQILSSPGSHHPTALSCSSSPISPSVGNGGFRRAQSEGNLQSLISSSSNGGSDADDFSFFNPSKKFSSKLHSSLMLETIPSFSFHNSRFRSDEEEEEESDVEEEEEEDKGFPEFGGFDMQKKAAALNEQMGYGNLAVKNDIGEASSEMYQASGIRVDAAGAGGGGNSSRLTYGGGAGGGGENPEEHYKKMVTENPGSPLVLRNYAQFLYQSKQDLQGAEEYYSRAILADPNDGDILSQYAKLLWELHGDKERATGYFERAVQAATQDSHVHAAYASFLWEIEGEEDDEEEIQSSRSYANIPPIFNNGAMASATV